MKLQLKWNSKPPRGNYKNVIVKQKQISWFHRNFGCFLELVHGKQSLYSSFLTAKRQRTVQVRAYLLSQNNQQVLRVQVHAQESKILLARWQNHGAWSHSFEDQSSKAECNCYLTLHVWKSVFITSDMLHILAMTVWSELFVHEACPGLV